MNGLTRSNPDRIIVSDIRVIQPYTTWFVAEINTPITDTDPNNDVYIQLAKATFSINNMVDYMTELIIECYETYPYQNGLKAIGFYNQTYDLRVPVADMLFLPRPQNCSPLYYKISSNERQKYSGQIDTLHFQISTVLNGIRTIVDPFDIEDMFLEINVSQSAKGEDKNPGRKRGCRRMMKNTT